MLPDHRRACVRLPLTAALAIFSWSIARASADSLVTMVAGTVVVGLASAIAALLLAQPVDQWCIESEIDFAGNRSWRRALAAASAVIGGAAVWVSEQPSVVAWVFLLPLGLWAAAIDTRTSRIPAPLTYWAAAGTISLLLLASIVSDDPSAFFRAIAVAAASTTIMFGLAVATNGGIGMADVRLAFSLSAPLGYLSWELFIPGLVLPVLLMFPVAIARLVRGADRSEGMAAGPYMIVACATLLALAAVQAGDAVRIDQLTPM